MYDEFKGKTVVVTGGAQGIGRGISLGFAKNGANVICADINQEAGEALVAEGQNSPGCITFIQGDFSKSETSRHVVDKALECFGRIDILCNNVGIQPPSSFMPLHEYSEELWDLIQAVNLKSCFLMSKYCIPEIMKQKGGAIVNIASTQGLQSMKGVPSYAASKGGVLSLTRQMALEYADSNIRVNAVNPGTTTTPMLEDNLKGIEGDPEDILQGLVDAFPIGRLGRVEEIANAVLFLASEQSSFMTGEYLNVDGGIMAKGSWA